MGQLLVFVVPSIEVAAVIGILFNAVCLLAPQASTLQATSGFTPSHHCVYSFSALAAIAFGKCSNDQLVNIITFTGAGSCRMRLPRCLLTLSSASSTRTSPSMLAS
ncbi:hypothetical protein PC129_g16540 [Phytophthora cactorum]|uniref:Uncharacterized protein n=1 Tax=Phytophthora cactorum TaxID=29920 RepID=A0A329RYR2_9STRA|nr:hypothetical protein Pcac1_g20404 [Phytophthora cactorum]KAG3087386.1 hypothetical protein PI125_g18677 [Phytophthora idaei]KAG2807178.1 hypothetical protein PC111_g17040 [Phytophthora cactorum]KAG2816603.1 hypothetical protein PC112_g13392 [Phytophthora cactorum]KAG2858015.1 hypothetical protein PC113_g10201 [Phytophthora cactorum]